MCAYFHLILSVDHDVCSSEQKRLCIYAVAICMQYEAIHHSDLKLSLFLMIIFLRMQSYISGILVNSGKTGSFKKKRQNRTCAC